MADDLTPGAIRARKFGASRRGYDRGEVGSFMERVADRIETLEAELAAIHSRLDQLGIEKLPDFKSEIDELGSEIQAVMSAALAAAEGMRARDARRCRAGKHGRTRRCLGIWLRDAAPGPRCI